MKSTLLICLLAVFLAGCSSFSSTQTSRCHDCGISDALYARMQARQKLSESDIVELSQRQVHSSEIMAYLAYTGTEIPVNDDDARRLAGEKVKGDVITYLQEKPNHAHLLSVFSSWSLNDK